MLVQIVAQNWCEICVEHIANADMHIFGDVACRGFFGFALNAPSECSHRTRLARKLLFVWQIF